MQRKVIQQGPSTMMVSLPSTWIKENAVKKGDFIDLDLRGDEITLSITTDKGKKSCKINFSRKEDYFDRIIVKKYREGFDEIIVTYEDPTIMEKIRKTLKKLLGFEIIEQTQNSCTIGNLAKGSSEDYLQMVRRMFQITLALGESCLKLTKGNKQMIDAIQEMNETLIPLEQYNLRLIQLQKEFSPDKKISDFFLIWNIGLCGKKWASFAKDHLTKNNSYTKK
ncbi:hypothetical protein HOI04_02200, partial [archaeon]|nr:hypothetical protein [archaeon]